ncbi:hypothetical protein IKE83_00085 [Candidatus Saccharibacteria bacterium]|nr:hypothetical protein [Candidatus Saccharibacteria bacterium]
MKSLNLKIKIFLSSFLLTFLTVILTTSIIPWNSFAAEPYYGQDDPRFSYTGNYETKSTEYRNNYYDSLRKADTAGNNTQTPTQSSAQTQTQTQTQSQTQSSTPSTPQSPTQNTTSETGSNSPMSGIRIAEADGSPYNRNDYGSGWNVSDLACNIRATILQAASLISYQTAANGCTVTYGSWLDPYSGATLTGNPYQGDGTANDLDIDHVIPLGYVNSHGGYSWSSTAKLSYGKSTTGMKNGVYLAVSATENRKKSDKGPADYYPPNPDYYCTYSLKWRDLARLYDIALSARDYYKIEGVLRECGIN